MPQSDPKWKSTDSVESMIRQLEVALTKTMKLDGFTETLKSLNRGRLPSSTMMTVKEGVIEERPSGLYDAALETEDGPLVLEGARRAHRKATDPQSFSSRATSTNAPDSDMAELTGESLLENLTREGANPSSQLVCAVELVHFDPSQHEVLLPILWQYILDNRNSISTEKLAAVGAAIRKYISLMPMDQMGELAVLLESGTRSPLPVEFELEVVKMIYRNFEVHPPDVPNPHPELAQLLWDIVQLYTNPRILLRNNHPAIASLAIAAIVSMRSPLAKDAWHAATECPYGWFTELVNDDIDNLLDLWQQKCPDSADWLMNLRDSAMAHP